MPEISLEQQNLGKIHCEHCGRFYPRNEFYLDKNGNPMKKCKKCMASLIDLNSRSTVMNIMEEVDIPFIPEEWEALKKRYEYVTDKKGDLVRAKNANQSVLGRYLGKMKLIQFRDYSFKDTDQFIQRYEDGKKQERGFFHQRLDEFLNKGYSDEEALNAMLGRMGDSEEIEEERLSKNELKDLHLKWGDLYNEDELIRLETFYGEMHESYDITSASHEDYLKQICKTSLRMHNLIDQGMYDEYQKLSNTYDKMMKSAKFTASQEKEENKFIDSISEMVRLCEEQGFIPVYHSDEPQDIVDVTLRDLNNYTRNLVAKELNLDSLMEKGLEQIKLDEEKDLMSADDALFMDDDIITDDEKLFEVINTDFPPEMTPEAQLLGVEIDG